MLIDAEKEIGQVVWCCELFGWRNGDEEVVSKETDIEVVVLKCWEKYISRRRNYANFLSQVGLSLRTECEFGGRGENQLTGESEKATSGVILF